MVPQTVDMTLRQLLAPLVLVVVSLQLVSASATNKMDYLQPYKFVKPLEDLDQIFADTKTDALGEVDEKAEDTLEQPIAEARSGEAAPLDIDDLMTASLSAPEPVAEKLVDNVGLRSRKKKTTTSSPTTQKSDQKQRSASVDQEMEAAESAEPRMAPLRSRRLPPRPEDEYYYYYDDDYYYDDYYSHLDDDLPTRDNLRRPEAPVRDSQHHQPHHRPAGSRPAIQSHRRPEDVHPHNKHHQPAKAPSAPPTKKKPTSLKAKYDKPKHHRDNSQPKDKELHHSRAGTNSGDVRSKKKNKMEDRNSYNIHSTINRLKGLREKQVHRAGKPSLPNPWEKFNLPPRSKPNTDTRFRGDDRNSRPAPNTRLPPPPPAVHGELYADEYYYDYVPVQPVRRNGGSRGANPLALLVAPLAGIALLTAAAAVAINPVLVTVSLTGRRRKRGASEEMEQLEQLDHLDQHDEGISPELEEKIHEMQVLEKFMSSVPDNMNYQHQVLSMYLSCSGYTEVGNACIDRLVCEYADDTSDITSEERDVISIVLYNIMSNEYVDGDYKDRLRLAAKQGRDEAKCLVYECEQLSKLTDNSL